MSKSSKFIFAAVLSDPFVVPPASCAGFYVEQANGKICFMKKEEALLKKEKYAGLTGMVLVHKVYKQKMKVVETGIMETPDNDDRYLVYCKLTGDLGHITETLDYVLANYSVRGNDIGPMPLKVEPTTR